MSSQITPNQRRAIEHIDKSCVLTAGAGSGKTRVLVSRYLRIITEKGDNGKMNGPERVIAITFTEKAASEMRSRLESEIRSRSEDNPDIPPEERISKEDASLLLERLPQARIMTIDSFCMNLVRANPLHAGVVAEFAILSPSDSRIIAVDCVNRTVEAVLERNDAEDRKALRSAIDAFKGMYTDMIDELAGNMITAETKGAFWLADEGNYKCTGSNKRLTDVRDNAFNEYKRKLREMRAMDFAMVENAALELLRSEKGKEIRSGITSVLVDEYQDTNDLQDRIVRLLVCDDENDRGAAIASGKLFIVGDPNQSIYAFRGANPDVFSNWMEAAKEKRIDNHLEKNFRSHPSLVGELNETFKQLFGQNYEEVEAGRSESAHGSRILVLEGNKGKEPAEVARLIKGWVGKGLELAAGKKASYGDIALLLRKNKDSKSYTAEFENQGIPYLLNKSDNVFASDSCLFIADLIDASLDDMDPMLAYSVMASPALAISQASIVSLKQKFGSLEGILSKTSEEVTAVQASLDAGELDRFMAIQAINRTIREERRKQPSHSLLQEISDELGFETLLLRGFGRQGVANLRKLIEISQNSALGLGDIGALSEYIRQSSRGRGEVSEPDILDSSEDAVKVMTIHSAKGLEFPIVIFGEANMQIEGEERDKFVTDSEDWSLGCTFLSEGGSKARQTATMENMRIVYVAMTRAKDYLVLTSTAKVNNRGKRLYAKAPIKSMLDRQMQDFPGDSSVITGTDLSSDQANAEAKEAQEAKGAEPLMLERQSDRQYRFSPSSLMQFELCPKEYLRRYWFRLMELGRYSSTEETATDTKGYSGAALGTLVHLACSLYEEGDDIRLVLSEAESQIYGKKGAPTELTKAAHALCSGYIESLSRREKPGKILKEVPFTLVIDKYLLEGTIDRIEQNADGTWTVVDIKTNSNVEAKAELLVEKYSLQMQAYKYAVNKLVGEVARTELHFINCVENKDSILIKAVDCGDPENIERRLVSLMDSASEYVARVNSLSLACSVCDMNKDCHDNEELMHRQRYSSMLSEAGLPPQPDSEADFYDEG